MEKSSVTNGVFSGFVRGKKDNGRCGCAGGPFGCWHRDPRKVQQRSCNINEGRGPTQKTNMVAVSGSLNPRQASTTVIITANEKAGMLSADWPRE